jgi:hypothetical protein
LPWDLNWLVKGKLRGLIELVRSYDWQHDQECKHKLKYGNRLFSFHYFLLSV